MMALSAFSYSNIFFMFQNLFLSVSNAETLYYFYYFFEKSRATVAHFFSTMISLFLPTTIDVFWPGGLRSRTLDHPATS